MPRSPEYWSKQVLPLVMVIVLAAIVKRLLDHLNSP